MVCGYGWRLFLFCGIKDLKIRCFLGTYKVKAGLPEHIAVKIIYYEKIDDGIEVDYGEIL